MNTKHVVKDFFRSYLDLPMPQPKIVCIGGGTGMPTLLAGLKKYTRDITAIVTMADEGGSTGRLRRLMGVPAVGDVRKALSALADEQETMTKLLAYRFKGERYDSNDDALGGHSFGNLFLSALTDITGDFESAMEEASRILKVKGRVLPSTKDDVHIWAETNDGEKVYGEENIDLGRYGEGKSIAKLHLNPEDAKGYGKAIEAIKSANIITAGPGDLYTSIMPNLLIADIANAIKTAVAKKIFVVNIANKPFETANYTVNNYIDAIKLHTGFDLFDTFIVNNNQANVLPEESRYTYVTLGQTPLSYPSLRFIEADIVNADYPFHHDARKLATIIVNMLKS